jgi:hypothetical protein
MPEIIPFAIGVGLIFAIGGVCFRAGQDAAKREAFYTISSLRESLTRTRIEVARLDQANQRLAAGHKTAPVVETPTWMR